KIAYLDGLTIEALERRLAALPPRSAVLLGAFRRDGAGRTFVLPEVVPRLRAVTRAPIYTLIDNALGLGAVGGHVISFEAQGREAAELAVQMLRGERPPVGGYATNLYRFDARELAHWKLDARRLPPSSELLFAAPSLWRTYRGWIVAAAVLL